MSKNTVFVRDIISKFFPEYTEIDANDLNVERIFEKCIAEQSGLKWVGDNNEEFDFSDDLSDAKTSSCTKKVSRKKDKKTGKTYTSANYSGKITSVETKVGDLRCAVYNELTDKIDYFLIPFSAIERLSTPVSRTGKGQYKKQILFSYNIKKGSYSNHMEDFRYYSFEDICRIRKLRAL